MLSARVGLLGLLLGFLQTPASGSMINFTAWDHRNVCFPRSLQRPTTVEQVVSVVKAANAAARGQVKVYGAGHSFSRCALTDPISASFEPTMLNLDSLNKILSYPTQETLVVRVQAGIRVHDLNSELHAAGFALFNAGAIAEQSVAGATQTSTHGTGRELGSMSTQILSLTMVLANGTITTASATQNKDLYDAGRVGLGALGVVVEVELKVRPAYKLRRSTVSWDLDELIAALPALNKTYDRLQWYWTPNTPNATLLLREEVPSSTPIGEGCWGAPLREMHTADETLCTDWSYKALSHPSAFDYSRALYTEMEYFVPRRHAEALVADFREYQQSIRAQLEAGCRPGECSLFAGIRYVARDDIWLSMMSGEDIAVLSSIVTGPPDRSVSGPTAMVELIDRGLERIAAKYGGRPHWGKWHEAKQGRLRSVYPRFDDFRALQSSLDPRGIFLNDWLRLEFGA